MKKTAEEARLGRNADARKYAEKNRKIILEKAKKYADKNREAIKKKSRAAYKANPGKTHSYQIWHRYGITEKEYWTIFDAQGGCCAICGKTRKEDGRNLSVDHNHKTGKVRGLLCWKCNRALGHFDSLVLARNLFIYMEKFESKECLSE